MFKYLLGAIVVAAAILTTTPSNEVHASENTVNYSAEIEPHLQWIVRTSQATPARNGQNGVIMNLASGTVLDVNSRVTHRFTQNGPLYNQIRNVPQNNATIRNGWVRGAHLRDA